MVNSDLIDPRMALDDLCEDRADIETGLEQATPSYRAALETRSAELTVKQPK